MSLCDLIELSQPFTLIRIGLILPERGGVLWNRGDYILFTGLNMNIRVHVILIRR